MTDTDTTNQPAPGQAEAVKEHQLPQVEALKDLTLLSTVCDAYLGMSFVVARRNHSLGTLPVKAFRLTESRRGPLFVHNDDLAKLIERRRKKAVAPAPAETLPELETQE